MTSSEEFGYIKQKLDHIHEETQETRSDVRQLKEHDIPAINVHLSQLNGSVAHHDSQITGFQRWRDSLPCADMRSRMSVMEDAFSREGEHTEEKIKKHSANWGQIIAIAMGLLQTLLLFIILGGGSP